MAYPNDGDPVKWRILEAIKADFEAVATPDYHFTFEEVRIYDSGRIQGGTAMPFIAIIPEEDSRLRELSCTAVERQAIITIVGAIRLDFRDPAWKKELHWLVSDMKYALQSDPKLSNTCIYQEVEAEDVYEITDETIGLATISLRVVYRHLSDNPTLTTTP